MNGYPIESYIDKYSKEIRDFPGAQQEIPPAKSLPYSSSHTLVSLPMTKQVSVDSTNSQSLFSNRDDQLTNHYHDQHQYQSSYRHQHQQQLQHHNQLQYQQSLPLPPTPGVQMPLNSYTNHQIKSTPVFKPTPLYEQSLPQNQYSNIPYPSSVSYENRENTNTSLYSSVNSPYQQSIQNDVSLSPSRSHQNLEYVSNQQFYTYPNNKTNSSSQITNNIPPYYLYQQNNAPYIPLQQQLSPQPIPLKMHQPVYPQSMTLQPTAAPYGLYPPLKQPSPQPPLHQTQLPYPYPYQLDIPPQYSKEGLVNQYIKPQTIPLTASQYNPFYSNVPNGLSQVAIPSQFQYQEHPSIRTAVPWTLKESKLLLKLRGEGLTWKEIASHFPNRTLNACQFRWKRISLNGGLDEDGQDSRDKASTDKIHRNENQQKEAIENSSDKISTSKASNTENGHALSSGKENTLSSGSKRPSESDAELDGDSHVLKKPCGPSKLPLGVNESSQDCAITNITIASILDMRDTKIEISKADSKTNSEEHIPEDDEDKEHSGKTKSGTANKTNDGKNRT